HLPRPSPIDSRNSCRRPYPGTRPHPIVTHNFWLARPGYNGASQCDGDSDADDHSTGSPSSHCQYLPETAEASACQPYPWSCTLGTTSSTTSSPSTTTGATTTTTTTSTSTTTTTARSPTTTSP